MLAVVCWAWRTAAPTPTNHSCKSWADSVRWSWFDTIWNRMRFRALVQNQQTKGNNSARQTRDTTTKTWITYSNSTWHASKYKVYPPQKVCPQKRMPPVAYIYPPFQAHSAKQVCTGIWQNQFLFFNGFFNTCTCLQYLRSSTPSEINHPVLGLTERP